MAAPLVPADVVIPVRFVPIYPRRLFNSTLFAVATPAEFRAAFCLWVNSWEQRPSGSLPATDRELCRLAELGGDLAKWGKVKRLALRHWELCDDGRMYHPVVAEYVLEAWNLLNKKRAGMAVARSALRRRQDSDQSSDQHNNNPTKHKTGQPPLNPLRNGGGDQEDLLKNGKGGEAAPPQPVHPKIKGHALPCDCPNCTRWVELHKEQRTA